MASSYPASSRLSRRLRPFLLATLLLAGIYWFTVHHSAETPDLSVENAVEKAQIKNKAIRRKDAHQIAMPMPSSRPEVRKSLVVASMKGDNTSWLFDSLPDWHKSVYVVDDRRADLTVVKNKGRESMVYLTYIIDNYDNLPDYMLFIHANRFQWHNDDPYYDGQPMIANLQMAYLERQGYVNLRCVWVLGCPDEIHPFTEMRREDVHAGAYFKSGFQQLFPGEPIPETVGVSCCAQFGLTRWKIHERPKSDYERYKQWLLKTPLKDDLSGRIMEYSWHMIFGMEPVHCPNAAECYCNIFGLCDLSCNEAECEGRYMLPRWSNLPQGWPYTGWNGQPQDPNQGGLPQT